MIYLLFLAGLIGLITLTETQAVFAPADKDALKAAVGTCTWQGCTGGGCLGETPDGSCPTFAASTDATGNPYGVIGDWDVSAVDDMGNMFEWTNAFNGDISKWNTGKVTKMREMFYQAHAFNADISKWNTGKVTDMESVFKGAVTFNNDISKWDTGAVTTMKYMFQGAVTFNSDISKWDTGKVIDMELMFSWSTAFNGDISKWNTGKVTNMDRMFESSSFTRTLCGGAWESLSSDSELTSTGRLGCCPTGSYMSNPMSDPFSEANSCSLCANGTYSIGGATTSCPYSEDTCPVGTHASETACLPCGAGTYNDQIGGTCAVCSAGKYSTTVGSTYCDDCPADTTISDTTTASKHDQVSDCKLPCSFENGFIECTDDQWQEIKAFYSERCTT